MNRKQRERLRRKGNFREMLTELRFIGGYGKQYKWEILWYVLLGTLGTGTSLTAGVLSKQIIDAVTGKDSSAILPAAVFYFAMQVFSIVMRSGTEYINTVISVRIHQEMRAEVYDKVMLTEWMALNEYHSGDLLNRVDKDLSMVSKSVLSLVPTFVTNALQFAGAFALILYYDPTLAVLALLSAPITVVLSRFMTGRMREYSVKMREIGSEMMSFTEESFGNLHLIKSFGLTELYGRKLREVQQRHRELQLRYSRFSITLHMAMSLIGTVVSVGTFCWCAHRLWSGEITYGTMTMFLHLSTILGAAFLGMSRIVPDSISAAAAAGRIMAISELPKEEVRDVEEVLRLKREKIGIAVNVEHMCFGYDGTRKIFDEVDFVARPGEVVALVGSSGEGKTTLLRLLLGLVKMQSGSVRVHGDDGTILEVGASTRELFAYVPQENTLFAQTIAENLRLMKQDATDEELNKVLDMACAYEFVRKRERGLYAEVGENGGGFSEGQIQRLAIARALLADAPILLLDEATSALDIETERALLYRISGGVREKTCIVTTHRPSVLELCDRVYRVNDGKVTVVSEEEIRHMRKEYS